MSAPLANYVDLIRHSAVRLALADAPGIALRLMLAHAIGGGRWWSVEAEPRRSATAAIAEAAAVLASERSFAERRTEAARLLSIEDEPTAIVDHDGSGARTCEVFGRLLNLSDDEVMRILAVVMAETLAPGTTLIDALGQRLGVEILQHWQPDEVFFALLKDREAIGAMLAEVIGETAARSYLTATGAKKKEIIRKALNGDGRAHVTGWTPRPMAFPQGQYTQRHLAGAAPAAA